MDSLRYFAAFLVVVISPPCILWWLLIHPLVILWRKLGWITYSVVGILTFFFVFMIVTGTIVTLSIFSEELLTNDFGTNYFIISLSVIMMAAGLIILWKVRKELTTGIQFGLPELAANENPRKLLKEGIYSRIRHPRYLASIFGIIGWALFSNFKMPYIFTPFLVLGIYLIVILEERELRIFFGSNYEKYCREVPRFIPKSLKDLLDKTVSFH